ncbi:transcriptional regulator CtsR [Pullulanibacillus pueri]|uniref:Transcriptional regulator CtsR n=1 Tax=Pullulanibacillus pueri TaxID=1437324 RepID=A0A8J2ZYN0_9BACL|nr:CtsR family transcriptional regulator [Pullulanibacillus pueri]MBM7683169.1 transcriptional regulator CtsR [Pullulanibacillus pueri]GGH85487.1 transcriptional regulator [Pullulanibacillus pueri]
MRNISDIIEEHIKEILGNYGEIEIKRSEMAEKFQCVPSQINYVLKTRFSLERGYVVESKRGGGGYIKIVKVKPINEMELIDQMIEFIDDHITQTRSQAMIVRLFEEELITQREAKLMISAIDRSVINLSIPLRDKVRANILRAMLQALRYKR